PGQRRRDEPRHIPPVRRVLGVLEARADDPTLVQPVLPDEEPAERVLLRLAPLDEQLHLVRVAGEPAVDAAAAKRELAVTRTLRRPPAQREVEPADPGPEPAALHTGRAGQPGEAQLEVRRAVQVVERVEVRERTQAPRLAEGRRVAAARELRPDLVGTAEELDRRQPVQRNAGLREPVLAEEGHVRERELLARERVRMPAVELAESLPELPERYSEAARKVHPLDVRLLDLELAFLVVVIVLVLEGHEPGAVRMPAEEDLGTRVRIEGGLKRELQRPGDEVVLARLRQVDRGEEVARHRQLGVQRLERTLPADEGRGLSCGRRVRGVDAAPASRRGRGRGTERGE